MSYVARPSGEAIAYCRHPGGDPVLLVHGFGSDSADTWDATGWLRTLAEAGRGAVTVDLRGHGASSKPHDLAAYRPSVLAGDLIAVLDAESLETVDVMGYSMGSQVARALAGVAPDRVHRLVLGGIGAEEQLRSWGVETIHRVLIEDVDADDPTATAILRAAASGVGADREALAACALGVASDEPATDPLPMPTLVAVGEADPLAAGADALARALGAAFVSVPKRNHVTTLSARAFKATVLAFLG
ncbi:MAG: alpha/beta fold hydrolase [Microbacteriaceae bacterium]|nr:MAG: alpha/beta fold hydrolase [Microbacteriaceae bacterium]